MRLNRLFYTFVALGNNLANGDDDCLPVSTGHTNDG